MVDVCSVALCVQHVTLVGLYSYSNGFILNSIISSEKRAAIFMVDIPNATAGNEKFVSDIANDLFAKSQSTVYEVKTV